MNCPQFDIKGYFLGELAGEEQRSAEEHLKGCPACQEELERLRSTRAALATLVEEEPPRRIAFVSDKIFEPSGWARFWNSAPRLVFASAAMLAVAITAHGWLRGPAVIQPAPDAAAMEARLKAEMQAAVQTAVEKAVAEVSARQEKRTAELLAAAERRHEEQRMADRVAFEEAFQVLQKRMNVYRASLAFGSSQ